MSNLNNLKDINEFDIKNSILSELDIDEVKSYTDSEKNIHYKKWTKSSTEDLLRSWGEKAGGLRWMHVKSARYWRKVDKNINMIGITLSSVISASSITGTIDNTLIFKDYIMSFVGIIGMLNILNQSLQRLYNASEKAGRHEIAAQQFGNFNRYIATKLSLARTERGPPKDLLEFGLIENERLHKENIEPHISSVEAFKKKFAFKANNQEFDIPDFVTNTFKINIYDEDNINDDQNVNNKIDTDNDTDRKKNFSLATIYSKMYSLNNKKESNDINVSTI